MFIGVGFKLADKNVDKLLAAQGVEYTHVVSDDLSSHRSVSTHGAKLLIVDGDFLKAD